MWALFRREKARVEGSEHARGDPWWGRPTRCVTEGVEMTTPSAISMSRTSNSFIVNTGLIVSRWNMLFRRPHPSSHTTTTPTCARTPYRPNCHRDWTKRIAAICTLALATSEPSKPQDTALPLQKTRKKFVCRGISCDTWHVYARIKENTSGRAFGGLMGIDLGVYDGLQVSLESAAAGTRGYGSIQTRWIWAWGNARARRCTMYTELASKEQRGSTLRHSLSLGSWASWDTMLS